MVGPGHVHVASSSREHAIDDALHQRAHRQRGVWGNERTQAALELDLSAVRGHAVPKAGQDPGQILVRITLTRAPRQVPAPVSANVTQLIAPQASPAQGVCQQLGHADEFTFAQNQRLQKLVLDHPSSRASGGPLASDQNPLLLQAGHVSSHCVDVHSGRLRKLAQRCGSVLIDVTNHPQAYGVGDGFKHGG